MYVPLKQDETMNIKSTTGYVILPITLNLI